MSTRLDFSKLTLMDALDLAALIELEAYKRYTQFAEQLGSRGTGDAGGVFQSMAVNENKHCEQLAERRLALFGDRPPKVKLDDIFDVEAPDFGAPRWDMSPLKAYHVALSSEKKALRLLTVRKGEFVHGLGGLLAQESQDLGFVIGQAEAQLGDNAGLAVRSLAGFMRADKIAAAAFAANGGELRSREVGGGRLCNRCKHHCQSKTKDEGEFRHAALLTMAVNYISPALIGG